MFILHLTNSKGPGSMLHKAITKSHYLELVQLQIYVMEQHLLIVFPSSWREHYFLSFQLLTFFVGKSFGAHFCNRHTVNCN